MTNPIRRLTEMPCLDIKIEMPEVVKTLEELRIIGNCKFLLGCGMLAFCVAAPVLLAADMATVPGGPFSMGDHYGLGWHDERPVHTVHVSEFLIDRHEVSNKEMCEVLQWAYDNKQLVVDAEAVRNLGGRARELFDLDDWNKEIVFADGKFSVKPGREEFPCIEVTWYGALAYCNFRSEMERLSPCIDFKDWSCDFKRNGYRLPTEAEWEKAARGGLEVNHFPWPGRGGNYDDHVDGSCANYWQSGDAYEQADYPHTTPVGYYNGEQTPPGNVMTNGYGLYDMAGNVWEWCWDYFTSDWYDSEKASRDDPTGPAGGTERVRRGGPWIKGQTLLAQGKTGGRLAYDLRCGERASSKPSSGRWNRGFRCVRRP